MKKIIICGLVFHLLNCFQFTYAGWSKKTDLAGPARINHTTFSIGNEGYITCGRNVTSAYLKDLWKYNQTTNSWTQMADLPGAAREGAVSFSIGNKAYIGTGSNSSGAMNDFWQYDPAANLWSQKASFSGTPRTFAVAFSITSKGYIGTGSSTLGSLKDFWEYDPAGDTWIQRADLGGPKRQKAVGFSIGGFGYITTGSGQIPEDCWEYNTTLNAWFKKADFPGTVGTEHLGFTIGTKAYVGMPGTAEMWEWDQTTDTWNPAPSFYEPRVGARGMSIGSKGYITCGRLSLSPYTLNSDLWELNPACTSTITGSSTTLCAGKGFDVTLSGNFTPLSSNLIYNWSPAFGLNNTTIANPFASPMNSTTYFMVAEDTTTKCISTSKYSITTTPTSKITGSYPICSGSIANICASGGVGYLWSTGANTSCISISPSVTTTYTVDVWDVNSCHGYTTTTVVVNCNDTSTCNNQDFGNGNFQNWNASTGYNTGNSTLSFTGGIYTLGNNAPVFQSNIQPGRHTIITISKPDTFCIDPATGISDIYMTTLAPTGGKYSVRLGNAQTGCEAEAFKIPFSVTATDSIFTYQYACVFQEPGHIKSQQDGFMVNVYDQNNILIPALCDTIYAGDPANGFITSAFPPFNGAPIQYKRWTGVSINLSAYKNSTVSVEFANFDCGFCGHFAYTYLDVACKGSFVGNVWPGDCDYDLNANNVDLLSLGIAYGTTGYTRSNASNSWTAQPVADWNKTFPLGANYKHSDCNGDGIVNSADTIAISLNYGNTHPFRFVPEYTPEYNTAYPDFYLKPSADTVNPTQTVNVDFMLGRSILPIDSIYGIAFRIYYDSAYVNPVGINTSFSSSWFGVFGTNMLTMSKNYYSQGQIDIAFTRIDHTNILGGNGKIGGFTFKAKNDSSNIKLLNLHLADVVAVTKTKKAVLLNLQDTLIAITPLTTDVQSGITTNSVNIFPNPANNIITIYSDLKGESTYEFYNIMGEKINEVKTTKEIFSIDVTRFTSGIYQLKAFNTESILIKKLLILK